MTEIPSGIGDANSWLHTHAIDDEKVGFEFRLPNGDTAEIEMTNEIAKQLGENLIYYATRGEEGSP